MSPQWFRVVVVTLIQLVLVFGQHSVGADFSNNCDDSTNSLSCIHTYDDLYNNLAKSDNSFNIEAALYPARRPSSVRVFVNLHGPIKAENPMARYTWSLSCLYVAVPPLMLEVLSLGSILVTPRTQTLNIAIPYFCCNVSKKEDERKKIIKETIKRALSALQDLAISPGIRDPRLNTAECVVEGHKIDIEATGRSVYIKIILWCSFLFSLAVFHMLASFIKYCRIEGWSENTTTENPNISGQNMKKIRIKYTAKAIFYLGVLLSFLGFSQQLALLLLLVNFYKDEVLLDIAPILVSVWFAMAFNTITGLVPHIRIVFENYFSWLKSHHTSTDLADGEEGMIYSHWRCFPKLVAFTCAATTSFCSCWMLIGIMLNPTWGLTVTLVICFTFASFTYAVYEYLTLVSCKQEKVKPNKLHALFPGLLGFLAVIFLIPVIVFAGQSFNGRETADETLKTILMTALGSFISWLSWKRLLNKSQKSEEKQSGALDKSQAGYPLLENGENIESVNEKQREKEITRESNV
ncbi:uncharacterized protein LOC111339455 [Stylophora pistillata]|uniref:uncharacterized protein LOC111339455 n=1 Tax=Stylophora pistillata TaxID=50429 RepID=UPI000C057969|nr:uncharacterized protein LOC111339455 [Stylophora pistillata]